jgi:hypothetical protein
MGSGFKVARGSGWGMKYSIRPANCNSIGLATEAHSWRDAYILGYTFMASGFVAIFGRGVLGTKL